MGKEKSNVICFACKLEINETTAMINNEVMLPVCSQCSGTEKEKKAVEELLDSLGEGFVCGCI